MDGDPAVITMYQVAGVWTRHSIVRLHIAGDRIVRVVDYDHWPWVLPAAASVRVAGQS